MKILFTKDQIAARVAELGPEISRFYEGRDLVVVIVITGGIVFGSDLIRSMNVPGMRVDTIAFSSYGLGHSTSGKVTMRMETKTDLAGRNVLLVDDMVDSGYTMAEAVKLLKERGAADVKTVALLDKRDARRNEFELDWRGFYVDNVYVVGCGLDDGERYRELPYVAAVD
ncbi:MAG: hypoxanthine phosphoribosyltransferase [Victivallaceae bacterium]|nr:hypoxanthine phosphoribosyltransferase [Victivallaceae bacterium]